ncbi:hypothetical protein K9O30_22710 [Clostridium bowmanii]|uniref:PepSY domain-containing protein n=1 Tax=Clostridium bowmanii TaxID=132925 RepID=UPI001C0C6E68|nr:PepSY domain-containing protein [Clostridium bowmanii]MBU3192239.1 PepSY domain-containing protein [Clostridium bowmanii]MCA1076466.1 hypothetical protein [Clostridium bowmanii]
MKNIFIKVIEFGKTYKKRIITVVSISMLTVTIGAGIVGKVVYSRAKTNTKYTQDKLAQIALGKVPGEVIDVEKELNFEEAVYEYEFKIKDKENMQQTVRVESKNGVILMLDNEKANSANKESKRNYMGERVED